MNVTASLIVLSCLLLVSVPGAEAEAQSAAITGMANGSAADDGHAEASLGENRPRFGPPYPFTLDELWAQILKLAALPEGYFTRADVESTFAIQLLEMSGNDSEQPTYRIMHQDDDWYFSTGITGISKTESSYFFTWGNSSGDSPEYPPAGMCITPAMLESGMKATGWTLSRRKIQGTHTDPFTGGRVSSEREERNYRKGHRGVLWVNIRQGCLIELFIMAENHPHFE